MSVLGNETTETLPSGLMSVKLAEGRCDPGIEARARPFALGACSWSWPLRFPKRCQNRFR